MYPWSNSVREGICPIRVTIFIDNVHSGHRKYYSDLLALLFKLINKDLRTETCLQHKISQTHYLHKIFDRVLPRFQEEFVQIPQYCLLAMRWSSCNCFYSLFTKDKWKKMCLASFGIQLTTFLPQNLSKWANTWIFSVSGF